MKLHCSWQTRLTQILLGVALAIALLLVHGTSAQNGPVHMATDWSHRHLIFSAPKNLVHAFQLSSNARYVQQWVRRNAEIKSSAQAWRWRHAPVEAMKGDWSMNMGTGARVGQGQYPAKFAFMCRPRLARPILSSITRACQGRTLPLPPPPSGHSTVSPLWARRSYLRMVQTP